MTTTPAKTVTPRSKAFTLWTEKRGADYFLLPPERLTVLRVLPSGRHVQCSDSQRHDLVCDVRNVQHFRRGMTITGAVLTDPEQPRLWRYAGPLPRRLGHW